MCPFCQHSFGDSNAVDDINMAMSASKLIAPDDLDGNLVRARSGGAAGEHSFGRLE